MAAGYIDVLQRKEGYDWEGLNKLVSFKEGLLLKDIPTLNPGLFSHFIIQYEVDSKQEKTLDTLPGLIAAYRQKNPSATTLEINVTHSLPEDQWARILFSCQDNHLHLIAHCAPEVKLPPACSWEKNEKSSTLIERTTHTQIIHSQHIHQTAASMATTEEWQVIDISECSHADLLMRLTVTWSKQEKRYHFMSSNQALLVGLENNKKIVLKGAFSSTLADMLAPLLLKRFSEKNPAGQLILIPKNPEVFNYLPHTVAKPIEAKGTQETKEAKIEFKAIQSKHKNEPLSINFKNSQSISEILTQQRIKAIDEALEKAPFVYLTGPTGSGKSKLIQKDFLATIKKQLIKGRLYQGEGSRTGWAQDKGPGKKYLFIDEENLKGRQWSDFEGLYNTPPGMLIDGIYQTLTKDHYVIFAGNPLNYGGDREQASFFRIIRINK